MKKSCLLACFQANIQVISYATKEHLVRDSTTYSGLYLPIQENAPKNAYRLIQGRQFLSFGFPFHRCVELATEANYDRALDHILHIPVCKPILFLNCELYKHKNGLSPLVTFLYSTLEHLHMDSGR